ncbi:mutacin ABC transporter, ATP-binding protein MutF family protein, partial [Ostertagia ostertagi]
ELTKYYGRKCALKGITFGVQRNDCFGLVGASGAGKTTAFSIIVGLTYKNSGKVLLNGRVVRGIPGIGFCPQFDSLADNLSAYQNMVIIAGMRGYRHPGRIVKEILRQLQLTNHCQKSFGRLSGGQKRRISTGVAILNSSNLLVLDEPTAGIDPKVSFGAD